MEYNDLTDDEIDAILAARPGLTINAQSRQTFRGFYRAAQRVMADTCSEEEIKGLMADAMVMARFEMSYESNRLMAQKDNGIRG